MEQLGTGNELSFLSWAGIQMAMEVASVGTTTLGRPRHLQQQHPTVRCGKSRSLCWAMTEWILLRGSHTCPALLEPSAVSWGSHLWHRSLRRTATPSHHHSAHCKDANRTPPHLTFVTLLLSLTPPQTVTQSAAVPPCPRDSLVFAGLVVPQGLRTREVWMSECAWPRVAHGWC